jgi:tetratricopeptide (TPR) repeat protein
MTFDVSTLWDFNDPALSEQRFRAALPTASADDALILQTQIARTYGLRRDFSQAQQILADIEPQIQSASVEAQARYYLELGRTYSSATHPPESQTAEVKERARTAYLRACELAQAGQLDDLAIDALHMMAVVDTAPEDQLEWNRKAVALMHSSSQPGAKHWAGSLHNNAGYALYLLDRYDDALVEFRLALAAREREGDPQAIRIAHWMIAWTLRALGRLNEALEIQLRLERECDKAGEPDPYVFEELELLYQAFNNGEKAEYYAARRRTSVHANAAK